MNELRDQRRSFESGVWYSFMWFHWVWWDTPGTVTEWPGWVSWIDEGWRLCEPIFDWNLPSSLCHYLSFFSIFSYIIFTVSSKKGISASELGVVVPISKLVSTAQTIFPFLQFVPQFGRSPVMVTKWCCLSLQPPSISPWGKGWCIFSACFLRKSPFFGTFLKFSRVVGVSNYISFVKFDVS